MDLIYDSKKNSCSAVNSTNFTTTLPRMLAPVENAAYFYCEIE